MYPFPAGNSPADLRLHSTMAGAGIFQQAVLMVRGGMMTARLIPTGVKASLRGDRDCILSLK